MVIYETQNTPWGPGHRIYNPDQSGFFEHVSLDEILFPHSRLPAQNANHHIRFFMDEKVAGRPTAVYHISPTKNINMIMSSIVGEIKTRADSHQASVFGNWNDNGLTLENGQEHIQTILNTTGTSYSELSFWGSGIAYCMLDTIAFCTGQNMPLGARVLASMAGLAGISLYIGEYMWQKRNAENIVKGESAVTNRFYKQINAAEIEHERLTREIKALQTIEEEWIGLDERLECEAKVRKLKPRKEQIETILDRLPRMIRGMWSYSFFSGISIMYKCSTYDQAVDFMKQITGVTNQTSTDLPSSPYQAVQTASGDQPHSDTTSPHS